MVDSQIRKQRCEDVLDAFLEKGGKAVFLTLTTPDVVDLDEIRRRWRGLRHYLVANVFPVGVKYVMNYELHPGGHGWHVHAVFNRFVPLRSCLVKMQSFGFGRIDVRRVGSRGVADYLAKHCLKAYRGVSLKERERNPSFRLRLVNTSRGLPRLSDYAWHSERKERVARLLRALRPLHGSGHFDRLARIVDVAVSVGVDDLEEFRRFVRDPAYEIMRRSCFGLVDLRNE